VNPVPDPLLLRKSGASRIEPETSGSATTLTTRPQRRSNYLHDAEWAPYQTQYFSENLVAPGIEPGNSETVGRNFDH
jgi:hypothetical protein